MFAIWSTQDACCKLEPPSKVTGIDTRVRTHKEGK